MVSMISWQNLSLTIGTQNTSGHGCPQTKQDTEQARVTTNNSIEHVRETSQLRGYVIQRCKALSVGERQKFVSIRFGNGEYEFFACAGGGGGLVNYDEF